MISYNLNEYGLRKKDMDYLNQLFVSNPSIERVLIFGSRAKGKHRLASDIDLALVGNSISASDTRRIHSLLENESPTLLWADVLHYNSLSDSALKKEIDQWGKVIYEQIPKK